MESNNYDLMHILVDAKQGKLRSAPVTHIPDRQVGIVRKFVGNALVRLGEGLGGASGTSSHRREYSRVAVS